MSNILIFFIKEGLPPQSLHTARNLRKMKAAMYFLIINLKSRFILHKIDFRKVVWLQDFLLIGPQVVPIWFCFSERELKKFGVGAEVRGHKLFSVLLVCVISTHLPGPSLFR